MSCKVCPFVLSFLRCFKCQRCGHSKVACRSGTTVCARCKSTDADHNTDDCSESYNYVNCKGEHAAYSRLCPKWLLKKEIKSFKTHQNLTYAEGSRFVDSHNPKVGVSYGTTLSKKLALIGTQIDNVHSFSFRQTEPSNEQAPSTTKNSCFDKSHKNISKNITSDKSVPSLLEHKKISDLANKTTVVQTLALIPYI